MSKRARLTRRAFALGTASAALAMPSVLRAQARELRILTWEGYAEATWLDKFRSDTGANVNVVYAGSADEMFAKMQGSNGADFDIVSFDTSLFPRYVGPKLIQPMDPAKIPNLKNLAPEFGNVAAVMQGSERHGVPFAWGSLPMVYDTAAFATPPDSWEVMWDEQYAQQMLWQDDANNSITLGALIVGAANPYQLTDGDFAKVKDKLVAQKKLLLSYYAGFDDGVNLFAQNGIKLMYSMGEPQVPALQKKGIKAALAIPKERAVGWLDCWEISAGAKDVDLAHAWINACLDGAVGKTLTEKFNYGNTTNVDVNKSAGLTYGGQLSWLETAENYEKRVAVWNEIKAA
jgi:putative spermidine/putrescine transport system substrate-binding protein/spermidine/putrescine transport system substrate-binding protein